MTKTPSSRSAGSTDLIKAQDYFKDRNRFLSPPIYRAAYSDRMAWILASMAYLAYDRFEDDKQARKLLVAKLRGGDFSLIDTFHSVETDTQAFLAGNKEYFVLAFRGTESTKLLDVKTDAMLALIPTIEGTVHAGFQLAYESVAERIAGSLKRAGDLPIYVTGHSLGAALATVATQHLERDPKIRDRIAACYTFGSPRVGNDQYDREFKSPVYRVVNNTDVVTVIPLSSMGYMHIGDVRFLTRTPGEIRRGIPIQRRLLMFFAALFRLFGPLIKDHKIVAYRRQLDAIADMRNPQTKNSAPKKQKATL